MPIFLGTSNHSQEGSTNQANTTSLDLVGKIVA